MAAKNVDIKINTTASGNGAKQTQTDIEKVDKAAAKAAQDAEKRAAKEAQQAERKAQREQQDAEKKQRAIDREAKALEKLAQKREALAQRQAALEAAEEARRAKMEAVEARRIEQAAARDKQVATQAARSKSYAAANVSNQVQDIAVQLEMGTNAMRVFSQQAPQLLGAFGPQGALVGGLLAIGGLLYKVFSTAEEDAGKAKKSADFLAEAVEKVGKEAGKIKSEEIDMGRAAISEAIGLSKLLAEGFKAASDQEREFSANALKSLNELKLAELELRKSRGEITDEKAAQEQRKIAQDQILQQAEEQKKAEAARIAEAQKAEEIARDELNLRARNLVEQQRMLDATIQEVEALRQRKAELEKIRNEMEAASPYSESGISTTPTARAFAARQELASTPFDARIKALEADVEALAKETSGNLQKDVTDAAKALLEAQLAVQNISSLVTGQVEQIDLAAQKEIVIETTTQLESQAKANSDLLKKTFENIQPINEAQQQGLLMIDQVTADGLLLAEETGKARSAMQLVLSSATTAQQINLSSVNRLLTLMNDYTAELSKQQKQIDNLEAKFKSIPSSPIK